MYAGHWQTELSTRHGLDAGRDRLVLGRVQYAAARVAPEVWAAAGRGDASRSYLIHKEQAPFRLVGVKVAVGLALPVKVFVLGEWRSEERFFQRLVGGGAVWTF